MLKVMTNYKVNINIKQNIHRFGYEQVHKTYKEIPQYYFNSLYGENKNKN